MEEDAKSDDETLVYESDVEPNHHLHQQQEEESEGEIDYGEEEGEDETIVVSDNEYEETNENGFVNTNNYEFGDDELPPLVPIDSIQNNQIMMQPVHHFPSVNHNVNYLSSNMPESGEVFYTWTFTYAGTSVNLYSPVPQSSSFATMINDDSYIEELVALSRERIVEKKLKACMDLLRFAKSSEECVEFEISKGTTDSILYEEFQKDDDMYILDDCFTNYHRFETLEQLFTVQKSNLNPSNQLPIERILKFKVKLI